LIQRSGSELVTVLLTLRARDDHLHQESYYYSNKNAGYQYSETTHEYPRWCFAK
jgi:hypothetical protein